MMRTRSRWVRGAVGWSAGCALLASAGIASAKPWKGAELITHETFRYGAFEARIRAARGSGIITPFFLWKHGSEEPGALWQEQDFEIFGRDGMFQTQLMTPGRNGTVRTEHSIRHLLRFAAWERYYTYRMEWTPQYLAFYVDNQLVRRETDTSEFAKLMNPAQAEAAQLRVGIWAGDYHWSSRFDPSATPAASFINWIQVFRYTPGQGPNGSDFTLHWRDDFNTLSSNRWWTANWTFDVAINDYVSQNATAKSGALVVVLTNEAGVGRFPDVPADDGQQVSLGTPWATAPFELPARIEAEAHQYYYDTSPGNEKDANCGATDVDIEFTQDDAFGYCNIAATRAGEWLEYEIVAPSDGTFDLSLRLAAAATGRLVHVELDGVDVSGLLDVPSNGWHEFDDVVVEGVEFTEGPHVLRVVFDTGHTNLNFIDVVDSESDPGENQEPGCVPSTRVYEAETLTATTGARTNTGWNLWSNGSISATHNFSGGDAVVRVNALGESAAGVAPHMVVHVGGQRIGDSNVASSSYAPFDFFFSGSPGSREIRVTFDNDYYADGQDRNLLLDSIVVDECPE